MFINVEYEFLFEEAYKANLCKVKYYVYSYLNDWEQAENVAQEAFYQLWKNRDKVNFAESVLPYLLFVSKNLALNILRKEGNKKAYVDYNLTRSREILNYDALQDSSATLAYSNDIEKLLDKAINKMPNKVSETFKLSRFNGLKQSEIAKKLEVSAKTVESRMGEALKILRIVFKDFIVLIMGYFIS